MGLFDYIKDRAEFDVAQKVVKKGMALARQAQIATERSSTYIANTDKVSANLCAAGIEEVLAGATTGQNGQSFTQDQHLRGTEVLDCTERLMQEQLWGQMQPGQLQLGFVPIEQRDEWQHFLLAGAPGTGKSMSIKWMLDTIRQRDEKALIFDPVGDMVGTFYRPGHDIILNPLDERDAGWYPWADLERHELPAFVKAIIPDPIGQHDPFWANAAQAVLQSLLLGTRNMDDLLRFGLVEPDNVLMDVVRKTGKGGLVGQEKTFSGVRAQLATGLDKLALLRNITQEEYKAGAGFSLKKWTENDDDRRWVFLLSKKAQQEALKPLITLWTDTVIRTALSLEPSPQRRVWLCLDELPSLGKLPSLASAMAEGRKFGLSCVLGLQTIQQLRQTYGKEEAAVVYGLPKNRLILRIHDSETCEEMSKELGEYQRRRVTTSTNSGSNNGSSSGGGLFGNNHSGSSNGMSTSEQLVTERAVMPAEIANLPDLVGYLRTDHQVAKVTLPVTGWPEVQPQHVDIPQRRMPWEI